MATAAASSAPANPHPPQFYFDEKWKLSKKESSSRSCCSSASFIKNPSQSQKRCAFTRKCARLVKQQRARFYIMRRCVTMLICWRDYGDSWTHQREEEVFEKEYTLHYSNGNKQLYILFSFLSLSSKRLFVRWVEDFPGVRGGRERGRFTS